MVDKQWVYVLQYVNNAKLMYHATNSLKNL